MESYGATTCLCSWSCQLACQRHPSKQTSFENSSDLMLLCFLGGFYFSIAKASEGFGKEQPGVLQCCRGLVKSVLKRLVRFLLAVEPENIFSLLLSGSFKE